MSNEIKGTIGNTPYPTYLLAGWIQNNPDILNKSFFGGTPKIQLDRLIFMQANLYTMSANIGYILSSQSEIAKWILVSPEGDPDGIIMKCNENDNKIINNSPNSSNLTSMILEDILKTIKSNQDELMKGKLKTKVTFDINFQNMTEIKIISGFCFGLSEPKKYKELTPQVNEEEWAKWKEYGLSLGDYNPEYKEDLTGLLMHWAKENNPYVYNNLNL